MLYKGDKGVNDTACPLEVGPAEAGSLSASNLPLVSIPHSAQIPDGKLVKSELRRPCHTKLYYTKYKSTFIEKRKKTQTRVKCRKMRSLISVDTCRFETDFPSILHLQEFSVHGFFLIKKLQTKDLQDGGINNKLEKSN